jgi:hypothetical protein
LALGDNAEPLSFYHPSQINTVDVNDSNVRSNSDECNIETIETEEEVLQNDNNVCENAVNDLNHCTKHLEHLRHPLINCYVILAQSRMQTSGKVSLQLLVE